MPPFAPENVSVRDTARGRISLQWQPAKETVKTPVDGYIIEMAPEGSTDFQQVGRVDGSTCDYDVTDVQDGVRYKFRIRTQNPSGISAGCAELANAVMSAPACGEDPHPTRLEFKVVLHTGNELWESELPFEETSNRNFSTLLASKRLRVCPSVLCAWHVRFVTNILSLNRVV